MLWHFVARVCVTAVVGPVRSNLNPVLLGSAVYCKLIVCAFTCACSFTIDTQSILDQHSIDTSVDTRSTLQQHLERHLVESQLIFDANESVNTRLTIDQLVDRVSIGMSIGLLQDPVTWYGINYAGAQMTQWDFQKKGKSGWTGTSSFVLEVPLRHLRPSVIYSVPCDRILQRAY